MEQVSCFYEVTSARVFINRFVLYTVVSLYVLGLIWPNYFLKPFINYPRRSTLDYESI